MALCSDIIPKNKKNLISSNQLKKSAKPLFGLALFLIIAIVLSAHKGPSPTPLSASLSQGTDGESSCSVLCQGEEKKEYPDMFSIQDNSLLALSPSRAVNFQILGAFVSGASTGRDIEEYVVQEGENLSTIADKFNISLETILWANELTSRSVIQLGQKLIIPPITGVLHLVRDGDTVSQLAQTYKAKSDEIVSFNGLSGEADIFIGDMLMLPNGRMPVIRPSAPSIPLASSYFILPLSGSRITQGLHWYNAIDFGTGRCGDPIYAAAGGTVQKTGYKGAYGYYIQILHPNGVATLYGHLSKISVNSGQKVSQGQVIGYSGYTGRTYPAGPAGCHLHFEVRGARNPFAY